MREDSMIDKAFAKTASDINAAKGAAGKGAAEMARMKQIAEKAKAAADSAAAARNKDAAGGDANARKVNDKAANINAAKGKGGPSQEGNAANMAKQSAGKGAATSAKSAPKGSSGAKSAAKAPVKGAVVTDIALAKVPEAPPQSSTDPDQDGDDDSSPATDTDADAGSGISGLSGLLGGAAVLAAPAITIPALLANSAQRAFANFMLPDNLEDGGELESAPAEVISVEKTPAPEAAPIDMPDDYGKNGPAGTRSGA